MNWIPWPESIKKRACRYILQNYVGEFLHEKIRLEQLNVDLYQGTGSVSGLNLNLSSLNEQLYTFGIPLEVIDGYVRNISIQIPWSALLTDSSQLTLSGLELSVQMAEKTMTMQGMCESLYQTATAMTTSIEIAEKVAEEVNEEIEGLDALSAYIEKVLARVKITLLDTVLRVESEKGDTKIELRIKKIEYLDETEDKEDDEGLPSIYLKKVAVSGVTFWHHQKNETSNFGSPFGTPGQEAESFYESPPESPSEYSPETPPPPTTIPEQQDDNDFALIGEMMGNQEVKIRIQPRDGGQSPKLSLDATFQAITFLVCPKQIHSILDLINSLSANQTKPSSSTHAKPIRPEEYNRIETQIFEEDEEGNDFSENSEPDTFEFRPGNNDAQFYSLYGSGQSGNQSMTSSMRSSVSSRSSVMTGSQTSVSHMRRKKNPSTHTHVTVDSNMGGYQYSFKLSSVSICCLHNDPTDSLADISRDYFAKMREFNFSGLISRKIKDLSSELHQIIKKDRLLVFAYPISGSVNQGSAYQREELQMNLQFGQMWLWEHLYGDSCPKSPSGLQIPILKFKLDVTKSMIEALPQVGHCFKVSMNQSRRSSSLCIELGDAILDLDLSLVDRISRLLAYVPKKNLKTDPQSHASLIAELSSPDKKIVPINFSLSAQNLNLILRIPIPDKRSENERTPWYQRNIRDEMFKVHLNSFNCSMPKPDNINISVKEILLYFCESEFDLAVPPIISIMPDNDENGRIGFPQINISTKSKPLSSMYHSYYDEYTNKNPQTVFSNQQETYGDDSHRQSVEKPASPEEIKKFKRNLEDSASSYISLFFPNVEIEIHSRQFYEKLFNRLAWDLAMWEPSQVISGQSGNFSQKKVFFELDIEDEGPAPISNAYGMNNATPFGLELEIGRGNVKLNCRESNIGSGPTINLDLAGFNLLFGAKYLSGIADHLFISAHDLQITHKLDSDPEETVWLYSTETRSHSINASENPVIAIAVKIENEETTRSLAHFTVGIALDDLSVRFRVIESGLAPWDHVGLVFQIEEELPVGYTPPAYITSLHLQLNKVQIDYRPIYLPTSSLLCIESFFISTILRPNSDKALLSMIGEDVCLYLTNRPPQSNQLRVNMTYDSYVKLVNVKLIEVMIRIDPESALKSDIGIRGDISLECCADSCAAVARLLRYVSVDGDFQSEFESSSGNTTSSSASERQKEPEDNIPRDIENEKDLSEAENDNKPEIQKPINKPEKTTSNSVQLDLLDAMDDDDFLVESRKQSSRVLDDSFEAEIDDFVDLEAEPGIGFLKSGSEPTVRKFGNFEIKESHFRLPHERKDKLNPPLEPPFNQAEQRIFVKELNLSWKMYAGVDFPISFEPMRMDRTMRGMQMPRSKSQRDAKSMVELVVSKFRLRHETFSDSKSGIISRTAVTLDELEILDRLDASNINKLLHRDRFYHSPNSNPVLFFKILFLRPDQDNGQVQMDSKVRLAVEPIRINLDQDTAFHLVKYFTDLSQLSCQDYSVEKSMCSTVDPSDYPTDEQQPKEIFFKEINFSPDLTIRMDYQGKRVETSDYGTLLGLIIGLGQLNCSQITFKRYLNKNGILGVDRLLNNIITEWGNDIKRNQIPQIVGGVGPLHSLRQLMSGFVELFSAPVEAYKRDGRVLRGVKKGASAFSNSTAVAALEMSGRMFDWIDFAASLTHDMVSTTHSSVKSNKSRAERPADFREGISNAYGVVHDGLKQHYREATRTIESGWDQRGLPGALGGAISVIPSSLARPVVLTAQAGSNVLAGARNQLRPEARREDLDKYKK